jgi:hypothetical protein
MTTESASITSGRPPRKRLSLLPKLLLLGAGVFAGLILLVMAVIAVENWRGHRAWAQTQREMAAQGEKLDLRAFVPPEIPEEQNFAALPLFARLRYRGGQGGATSLDWPDDFSRAQKEVNRKGRRGGRSAEPGPAFTDLGAWQRAFRIVRNADPNQPIAIAAPTNASAEMLAALEVLEGLKVYEPFLADLREASRRPGARFPIAYDEPNPMLIILPHLAGLRDIGGVLQLRAAAGLAAGQSADASDDVRLHLRLTDALKDEPVLISQLVRLACFHLAAVPVREGLARHSWTEVQLKELQGRLQTFDFLSTAQRAFRAERAFGLAGLEAVLREQIPLQGGQAGVDDPIQVTRAVRRVAPEGWLRFEQANYVRAFQTIMLPDADLQAHRMDPEAVAQRQAEFKKTIVSPVKTVLQHRLFARLMLPALGKAYSKHAFAQAVADQAVLACALERFRLAQGQFPDSLDALAPAYLDRIPPDVISGEPLRYERTPDGQFRLWSVGWNNVDDGGIPGRSAGDTEQGDWVWEYPPK